MTCDYLVWLGAIPSPVDSALLYSYLPFQSVPIRTNKFWGTEDTNMESY